MTVRVYFELASYNPGQNVWDKVPFSRIAAILARSPPPRCNVGRLVGKPFLANNIAWGEGGGRGAGGAREGGGGEGGTIWPKERLFPCEKLIDGRGSAFCKLVPHNFGQDCSHAVNITLMMITLWRLQSRGLTKELAK